MKKVFTAIFAFLFLFSAVGGAAAYVNAEEDTELAKKLQSRVSMRLAQRNPYLFQKRNAASSHCKHV